MITCTPLRLEDNGDGTFTLLCPFSVRIGELLEITVEGGRTTDYASVPWMLRWFMSPTGSHGRAAVIHDDLYRMAAEGRFPRVVADAIFLAVMEGLGVPWWRRWPAYLAVRIFGGLHLKRS